jgi:hypothetical protein
MAVPTGNAQDPSTRPAVYEWAAVVTPSDTVSFAQPCRGLYIGGAGSGALTVLLIDGTTCAFAGLTANTLLPIRAVRVNATGTNVTAIVALW